jgi:AraC-like DNA-binding protein
MALGRGEEGARAEPAWLEHVRERLRLAPAQLPVTEELAAELRIHPAWLARVYREREGEGLHETVRRRRMEYAAALIRTTPSPLADVAAAAGFCDQSHMNRAFRCVLMRTPGDVQAEVRLLRSLDGGRFVSRMAK